MKATEILAKEHHLILRALDTFTLAKAKLENGDYPEMIFFKMDIPDPSERVSGLPQNLRRFICKSCIRDPDKRYQDMAQGLDDLFTREEARAFSIRAGETI